MDDRKNKNDSHHAGEPGQSSARRSRTNIPNLPIVKAAGIDIAKLLNESSAAASDAAESEAFSSVLLSAERGRYVH